jgi:hypothetical protein
VRTPNFQSDSVVFLVALVDAVKNSVEIIVATGKDEAYVTINRIFVVEG